MTARAFQIASAIVGTLFGAYASLAIAAEKGVPVRAPAASAEASVIATDMRNKAGKDESMRAETQNLVEEIRQSMRLLRRHL